jgi:hypothetical protein
VISGENNGLAFICELASTFTQCTQCTNVIPKPHGRHVHNFAVVALELAAKAIRQSSNGCGFRSVLRLPGYAFIYTALQYCDVIGSQKSSKLSTPPGYD